MLTFFAHDHASAEMVYANQRRTHQYEQAGEVIAFADYWQVPPARTPACWSSTPN